MLWDQAHLKHLIKITIQLKILITAFIYYLYYFLKRAVYLSKSN